jgi:nucleotide-binding universal stress UspA family protein
MITHILVPFDGSTASEWALPYAMDLAGEYGARLTLLGAESPLEWETAAEYLETHAAPIRREGIIQVDTVAEPGDPAQVILKFARGSTVDLIVMSTRGVGDRSVGSVAAAVLDGSACPVLMVRGPGATPTRRRAEPSP